MMLIVGHSRSHLKQARGFSDAVFSIFILDVGKSYKVGMECYTCSMFIKFLGDSFQRCEALLWVWNYPLEKVSFNIPVVVL